MTIQEYYRKIKSVNLSQLKVQAAEKNKTLLLDLNREQMKHGLRADGEKIKPDYHSLDYAKYKQSLNPVPGMMTPDLHLSGAFYETLSVETNGMKMKVLTGVSYGEKLRNKYPEIFGLAPKSLNTAQQKVTTDFIHLWKQKIKT